ncbi:MAG: tRNA uridine-5-carboxymethylaminomethyl(34) synthesis enzyme MnmG, partial [Clostridia bacterium]|nr:tRNA uridine-5-carboxymethylaminomethyl(34) synthesis enzyme MnmG [Clostridia bacterium]
KQAVENEIQRLKETTVGPKDADELLEKLGSSKLQNRISLYELMRRPEVSYDALAAIDPGRPELSSHAKEQVQVQIKYEGYIRKQQAQVEKFKRLEDKLLPEDLPYDTIEGLRIEAAQKLSQIRPRSVGQAGRISGVSPADISVLMVYLEKQRRMERENKR